eukprot:6248486-Amphidinium_carterae.1
MANAKLWQLCTRSQGRPTGICSWASSASQAYYTSLVSIEHQPISPNHIPNCNARFDPCQLTHFHQLWPLLAPLLMSF